MNEQLPDDDDDEYDCFEDVYEQEFDEMMGYFDCLEDVFDRLLFPDERIANDCMGCGMCKSCVERSIAAAEEQ